MNWPTSADTPGPGFQTLNATTGRLRVKKKTIHESIGCREAPEIVRLRPSVRLHRRDLLPWTLGNSSPALGKKP
jgi:hypothetical protein